MNITSKKEERHMVQFMPSEILDMLKEQAIRAAGFDPEYVTMQEYCVNLKPVANIKGKKGYQLPIIEITILNPKHTHPQPAEE